MVLCEVYTRYDLGSQHCVIRTSRFLSCFSSSRLMRTWSLVVVWVDIVLHDAGRSWHDSLLSHVCRCTATAETNSFKCWNPNLYLASHGSWPGLVGVGCTGVALNAKIGFSYSGSSCVCLSCIFHLVIAWRGMYELDIVSMNPCFCEDSEFVGRQPSVTVCDHLVWNVLVGKHVLQLPIVWDARYKPIG